jgi:hypothetical protein
MDMMTFLVTALRKLHTGLIALGVGVKSRDKRSDQKTTNRHP